MLLMVDIAVGCRSEAVVRDDISDSDEETLGKKMTTLMP